MRPSTQHRSIHRRPASWLCQFTLAVMLMAACAPVSAQIADKASMLDVRIKTITDDALTGRLIALSARQGATLVTGGDQRTRVAIDDIVRITVAPPPSLARPRGFTVALGQGDVLHGLLGEGDAESLVVETVDVGRISVPLDLVARIDAARAREAAYRESVEWLDRTPSADEDRILLTNGDVVRGFITSVGAAGKASLLVGMTIEGALGETLIPRATIVAVRFASPTASPPEPPYQIVSLQSSGRLTIREIDWSGDVVKGISPGGGEIMIEAHRITDVELFGGKWEWLSHHTPISYQHTPMLAVGKPAMPTGKLAMPTGKPAMPVSKLAMPVGWGYARDRNVLDNPLRVAGKTYRHGLGVHSRASLTFDLMEKYREFVTAYGMDDDSGPHADVSVSILVDGRPRHREVHIRRGILHKAIRLDVAGAKRIELIVDFGDNGDIQDRFNWIEPALIR